MRSAAAQLWAVALPSSRRVIVGPISVCKHLVYLFWVVVKIKVVQTPPVPVPRPTQSQPATSTTVSSPQWLQDEITVLQRALQDEKELNAKRHADLLALLTALQPKVLAPRDQPTSTCFLPYTPYPVCSSPPCFLEKLF